jgi:hypothetical protein
MADLTDRLVEQLQDAGFNVDEDAVSDFYGERQVTPDDKNPILDGLPTDHNTLYAALATHFADRLEDSSDSGELDLPVDFTDYDGELPQAPGSGMQPGDVELPFADAVEAASPDASGPHGAEYTGAKPMPGVAEAPPGIQVDRSLLEAAEPEDLFAAPPVGYEGPGLASLDAGEELASPGPVSIDDMPEVVEKFDYDDFFGDLGLTYGLDSALVEDALTASLGFTRYANGEDPFSVSRLVLGEGEKYSKSDSVDPITEDRARGRFSSLIDILDRISPQLNYLLVEGSPDENYSRADFLKALSTSAVLYAPVVDEDSWRSFIESGMDEYTATRTPGVLDAIASVMLADDDIVGSSEVLIEYFRAAKALNKHSDSLAEGDTANYTTFNLRKIATNAGVRITGISEEGKIQVTYFVNDSPSEISVGGFAQFMEDAPKEAYEMVATEKYQEVAEELQTYSNSEQRQNEQGIEDALQALGISYHTVDSRFHRDGKELTRSAVLSALEAYVESPSSFAFERNLNAALQSEGTAILGHDGLEALAKAYDVDDEDFTASQILQDVSLMGSKIARPTTAAGVAATLNEKTLIKYLATTTAIADVMRGHKDLEKFAKAMNRELNGADIAYVLTTEWAAQFDEDTGEVYTRDDVPQIISASVLHNVGGADVNADVMALAIRKAYGAAFENEAVAEITRLANTSSLLSGLGAIDATKVAVSLTGRSGSYKVEKGDYVVGGEVKKLAEVAKLAAHDELGRLYSNAVGELRGQGANASVLDMRNQALQAYGRLHGVNFNPDSELYKAPAEGTQEAAEEAVVMFDELTKIAGEMKNKYKTDEERQSALQERVDEYSRTHAIAKEHATALEALTEESKEWGYMGRNVAQKASDRVTKGVGYLPKTTLGRGLAAVSLVALLGAVGVGMWVSGSDSSPPGYHGDVVERVERAVIEPTAAAPVASTVPYDASAGEAPGDYEVVAVDPTTLEIGKSAPETIKHAPNPPPPPPPDPWKGLKGMYGSDLAEEMGLRSGMVMKGKGTIGDAFTGSVQDYLERQGVLPNAPGYTSEVAKMTKSLGANFGLEAHMGMEATEFDL